jgi:hypothetical protein
MLTIRTDQIDRLAQERMKAFLARATQFIETKLRIEVNPNDVSALFDRGKKYELKSERDFVRYMFIAVAAGAGAMRPDPEWISDALRSPAPSDQIRLRRLFLEAARRLPDEIAERPGS